MIYDTFLYFGTDTDRQLLALRLALLSPVVDLFVLCEASVTHAGGPKPFYYRERDLHDPAIRPYADRIIPVGMADLPADATPLTRENAQRAGIMRGLGLAQPDDWVLVSDLDELPRPDAIRAIVADGGQGVYALEQRLSYYYLNCVSAERWFGTRMARRRDFTTTQTIRHVAHRQVAAAGWHMSYLGGVENIQRKLGAYLHQEYNTPEVNTPDHIITAMRDGRDLFDRPDQTYTVIPFDHTYPQPIIDHPARYADWFVPGTDGISDAPADAVLMPNVATEVRP